jgi:hypothetical protein
VSADPAQPATPGDPLRVQAVLAAAFGQPLHVGEIAHVLQWHIERVQQAAHQLASRLRSSSGLRVVVDDDTLTLDTTPRLLDPSAAHRLAQLLHAGGLGPNPHVYHLVYRLILADERTDHVLDLAPDVLDEAVDYALVTHDLDDQHRPTNIQLTPEVAYSLGLTDELPDDQQL